MNEKLLHARFFQSKGKADNKVSYDPHGFGLEVIQIMAEYADTWFPTNCIAYHHKAKSDIGHQVHVAATSEQWEAAKQYWESGVFN